MSPGIQFVYLLLAVGVVFIILRVSNNPITQIHRAVLDGDIEKVKSCLKKGVDVDTCQGGAITPLCLSSMEGNKEITKLLISYKANIDYGLVEEGGFNPLLAAAIGNHLELVEILIDNGAIVGMHMAVLQKDIHAVGNFLADQPSLVNSRRNRGMTPLHLSAMSGQLDMTDFLLNHGANINFFTPASETPLYQAIKFNNVALVEFMIDKGADINLSFGLQTAVLQNNADMIQSLIRKGADINYQNSRMNAPLHLAAWKGYVEVVELLLASGAQVNIKTSNYSKMPLHYAAEEGHLDVAKLLIGYNADINCISWLLATPLDHARSASKTKMMNYLKSQGAIEYGLLD
jgi:ankyrin repeat protein